MAASDVMDGIRRSTIVIVSLTMMDKVLALGKEMLFAYRFGLSHELDVFNVAYAFPAILAMFLGASVISALVPLYAAWTAEGGERLNNALSTAGWFCLGVFVLLATSSSLAAPEVFGLIGYGFPEGGADLGSTLVRTLSWLIFLEGAGAVFSASLQAKKSFAVVYGAQLLINVAIIAVLSLPGGGGGVKGLAWGFLAGSAAKLVVMVLALRGKPGSPVRAPFTIDKEALGKFLHLAWPLAVSGMVVNSNIFVDQIMSAKLPEGSVSALRYAYRINDLPVQLFIVAAANAIFPFISELDAARDRAGMRAVFWRSMLFSCVVALPVTFCVLLFSNEIVALLLKRGAFGPEAVASTAKTLACYNLGMVFYAYAYINGVFFHALRKNVTLLVVGCVTMAINVGLNILFIRMTGGPQGVAISTTVTSGLTCLIFIWLIERALKVAEAFPSVGPYLLTVGACLAGAGAAFGVKEAGRALFLDPLYVFPAALAVFALIYLWMLRRSKDEDMRWCLQIVLFSRGKRG